jgi:arsenate reductase (thioredoxin)
MVRPKVLFLCSENSCRTQMAEAFLRDMGGDRFESLSAGADGVAALDPDAIAVMLEVGIDISGQQPKRVDPFLRERVSYLVTLCERDVERTCPIFPGAFWRLKWPIENPAIANDRQKHRMLVRRARDEIRERVVQFVQEHS